MNLPFMTHWPDKMPEHLAGQPTLFPEKIWASIPEEVLEKWLIEKCNVQYNEAKVKWLFAYPTVRYNFNWDKYMQFRKSGAKIHTIRSDVKKRWKPGMMSDFWINYRTQEQFRFAPRIPVVSVLDIDFVFRGKRFERKYNIYVDNEIQDEKQLSKNDGFDTPEDFFAWFNEDFSGQIIQWTDFKY